MKSSKIFLAIVAIAVVGATILSQDVKAQTKDSVMYFQIFNNFYNCQVNVN